MVFLNIRSYSVIYYRLLVGLTFVVGGLILMAVAGLNDLAFQLIPGISVLLLGVEIAATICVLKKGYKPALSFLVGWGSAAGAVIVYVLGLYNMYQFTGLTVHIPELASTFEAVIFSYALAERLNRYRKDKEELILAQNVMLETKVNERTYELNQQKIETENLLLNILPADVAGELKEKGSAEARFYKDVTVLFTDFKGFTKVSERLTPQQLVDELHQCFKGFDEIVGRYGIEKIKTVGDAYLAAAGLPGPMEDHAHTMVRAALEIRDFMAARRAVLGEDTFEVRIGIHTGNVVAGIVGVRKFAYDIWGDTVNTAARMEQNSEPGRINISQSTWERVQLDFRCVYRGAVTAKNKGELNMYFVEGPL
jgi:class 3 adenylate cyclase